MLLEIQIQDFALIDSLRINFSNGLNIMTGETGAGKSIIIDSVNFVLGDRSSKDVIRTGMEKTYVEAVFESIKSTEFENLLSEYGISSDEGVLVLSRELNQSGRTVCRVNGRTVTVAFLKLLGKYLIDIHGQHEHQSLIDEENHIDILDLFGGEKICELKSLVHDKYLTVQDIMKKLDSLTGDDRERQRKLDLLDYQVKEICDADLIIGEEEELVKKRTILNNSGKLFSVLSSSYERLYESYDNQDSVFDIMGSLLSEFQGITNIDEKLKDIYKSMEDSYYMLEGAITDIREYRDKIDFNPEAINEVELRLELINNLKRKYGKSIEDILSYRDKINGEIQDILNSEGKISGLKKLMDEETGSLREYSLKLSDIRKKTAHRLQADIQNELKFLGLEKAKFVISFEIPERDGQVIYAGNGMDRVRFMISTNPGEPEKPLSKVASGGEISRIMLAIKTVLADCDRIPSLIFDEIDTGISGKAAQAVAEKLAQTAKSHQVVCVTHLPQIASMADAHFYISKNMTDKKTLTSIEVLNEESKIKEVARMLGGANLTELTLKHAEEMILMAKSAK